MIPNVKITPLLALVSTFGRAYCPIFKILNSEDGGKTFLRNVGKIILHSILFQKRIIFIFIATRSSNLTILL
jgi:hypothetical protein